MSSNNNKKYEATAESLRQYKVPEWFRDAKFGIFIHYGVYSVPGFGDEWYGHWMYLKDTKSWGGDDIYSYHKEVYGGPAKFGYKDFILEFNNGIKKWNPDEWAKLFYDSGAKYVMPVGIHHDSFALYDSDIQKTYNSVTQSGVDYVGDLQKSVKHYGMRFGVSNHYAENIWFFDKAFAKGTDMECSNFKELYGKGLSVEEHVEKWYKIIMEMIEKYHPELIYFDFDFQKPEYENRKRNMLSNYYNMALEWEECDGVVCNYKYEALTDGEAVYEVERGSLGEIRKMPWQTDTSIGKKSWGYTTNDIYRTSDELISGLVDIVSKNGNLLLNVGPRADGSIPEEAKESLLGIGRWLSIYGKAIYETRPYKIYGEGPNSKNATGEFSDNYVYTDKDIRFTMSKDKKTLYATALAAPESSIMCITSFTPKEFEKESINKISLVCSDEELDWKQSELGLCIFLPNHNNIETAYSVAITLA